jgi:hypothetical protein
MTLAFLLFLAVEPKQPAEQLLQVRRVYVDRLTGGVTADAIRDLLISSLQNSQLVQVTENEERADAFVRGSADQQTYTEVHDSNEGVTGRLTLGRGRGGGASRLARETDNVGLAIGEHESLRTQERRHEAIASVRIVLKNGDVIWSTTQESKGAKFRGAGADVADKVTRQLTADVERLRRSGFK